MLLQGWAHPIRDPPATLSATLAATGKPFLVFSTGEQVPYPPSAKVTSTKLLTEPAPASISLSTLEESKHAAKLAGQSSTFWLLWNRVQEHREQSKNPTPFT